MGLQEVDGGVADLHAEAEGVGFLGNGLFAFRNGNILLEKFVDDSGEKFVGIPQSNRMVCPESVVTRCLLPVTSRAAPRNCNFMVVVFLYYGAKILHFFQIHKTLVSKNAH